MPKNKSTISTLLREKKGAILFALFALVFLIAEANRQGDFRIFLFASEDILLNKNLYTEIYGGGFHYYYSPLFALLLIPLTLLPYAVAATIWKICSFLMLYRSFGLLCTYHPKLRQQSNLFILAFLAVIFTIYNNFHLVQMTACILYMSLEGLHQIVTKNRKLLGAGIIAFAINIKILPIVFIPYLFYRREIKAGLAVVYFFIALLLVPIVFIGYDYNNMLLQDWWNLLNPTNSKNIVDLSERGLHSLTSLTSTWFSDYRNGFELNIPRHIIILSESSISIIINIARALIIGLSFHFLRLPPFIKAKNKVYQLREIAYLLMCIPLIFPHQQMYAFLFLLPAAYYVVYFFMNNSEMSRLRKWSLYTSSTFAFLLINLELFLGLYRQYFWHFKTLSYGALFLMLALILSSPKYLSYKK